MMISRSFLLRMRNVSDKSGTENQNTHFKFSNFFPKIVPFMRKCGKCRAGWLQMAIWRMRIVFRIPKATNTHSQYVIRIAFPLQQWLRERASTLSYTYIACLVKIWNVQNFTNLLTVYSRIYARTGIWDRISKPSLFIRHFKAIPVVHCNLNSPFTKTTFPHLIYIRIQVCW
jgi:hypothetical protein